MDAKSILTDKKYKEYLLKFECQEKKAPFPVSDKKTTLTKYIELDRWTPEQAASLVAGIKPETIEPFDRIAGVQLYMAQSLSGLNLVGMNAYVVENDRAIMGEAFEAFAKKERVIELWNSQETPPSKISPSKFVQWCKTKNIDTTWLAEVESFSAVEQAAPVAANAPDTPSDARKSEEPQGKMPRTETGKLTVEAAWEIERETGKRTTSVIVMTRLQQWAQAIPNNHPALIKSIPHGVVWATKKERKEKNYMIEACGKHLADWYKSRT